LPVARPQSNTAPTPTSTDKKLSELVDDHIDEARTNLSAKTAHSFKASFNVMLEVIGDIPSTAFGFAAARQ
ncbi:MAG: hypothetical protein ACK4ZS_02765, partial [Sulfurimicrobium sp.]